MYYCTKYTKYLKIQKIANKDYIMQTSMNFSEYSKMKVSTEDDKNASPCEKNKLIIINEKLILLAIPKVINKIHHFLRIFFRTIRL